jgi:flagellar biosynthetic protein FliR
MAFPQLLVSVLLLLAAGVLSRLMPSMQIFSLLTPVQLLLSFAILMSTISAIMMWYIEFIHEAVVGFL